MPKPKCLYCGSTQLEIAGLCSFRWGQRGWTLMPTSAEIATDVGAPIICQNCGQQHDYDDINRPHETMHL